MKAFRTRTTLDLDAGRPSSVKILGLGGLGAAAVNRLAWSGLGGRRLVAADTDVMTLEKSASPAKVWLGPVRAHGLGCGGRPELGREAALESLKEGLASLEGAGTVMVLAGLGGGAGTGGAPVVIEALRRLPDPPLIIAAVSLPLAYGRSRSKAADPTLEYLLEYAGSVFVMAEPGPEPDLSGWRDLVIEAFCQAALTLTGVLDGPGDPPAVLSSGGRALLGVGQASGPDRAAEALDMALFGPLMDRSALAGAGRILTVRSAGQDPGGRELARIERALWRVASPLAELTHALSRRPGPPDGLELALIASGMA